MQKAPPLPPPPFPTFATPLRSIPPRGWKGEEEEEAMALILTTAFWGGSEGKKGGPGKRRFSTMQAKQKAPSVFNEEEKKDLDSTKTIAIASPRGQKERWHIASIPDR